MVQSFLNCVMKVMLDSHPSRHFHINAVVPQSSILDLYFFDIRKTVDVDKKLHQQFFCCQQKFNIPGTVGVSYKKFLSFFFFFSAVYSCEDSFVKQEMDTGRYFNNISYSFDTDTATLNIKWIDYLAHSLLFTHALQT